MGTGERLLDTESGRGGEGMKGACMGFLRELFDLYIYLVPLLHSPGTLLLVKKEWREHRFVR